MFDMEHTYYTARHQNKIDWFWRERKKGNMEGKKLCPNCWKIFEQDGYPAKGSWTCSEFCHEETNYRNRDMITQDTIIRIYMIDLDDIVKLTKNKENEEDE